VPSAATLAINGTQFTSSKTQQNNVVLGDDIKFNQYLSALVGGNYSEIIARSFNATPPFSEISHVDQANYA